MPHYYFRLAKIGVYAAEKTPRKRLKIGTLEKAATMTASWGELMRKAFGLLPDLAVPLASSIAVEYLNIRLYRVSTTQRIVYSSLSVCANRNLNTINFR